MELPGYRITARALDSHFVSEQVLSEYRGLDECVERETELVAAEDSAHRVVFVLEDEPDIMAPDHPLQVPRRA